MEEKFESRTPDLLGGGRAEQYDLLRTILVVLVVLGHATFLSAVTPFGGVNYRQLMETNNIPDSTFHRVTCYITDWIYTFHMPAFMALSGTIYSLLRKRGKYKEFGPYLRSKCLRLVLPLFTVWLLYNFPIKFFTGYYEEAAWYMVLLQILCPSNVYLWFLESLFIIHILIWILDRIQDKRAENVAIILLWLIGIVLFRKLGRYHVLGDPLYYLFWFYVGIHIENIRIWLEKRSILKKSTIVILVLGDLIFFAVYEICKNKFVEAGLRFLVLPLLMIVILYTVINHHEIRNHKIVQCLSIYGMGIYLYAEPLNYLLLYLFFTWFGVHVFGSEVGTVVLWLLRIFLTSFIAVGITWVLKKMNLKYLY